MRKTLLRSSMATPTVCSSAASHSNRRCPVVREHLDPAVVHEVDPILEVDGQVGERIPAAVARVDLAARLAGGRVAADLTGADHVDVAVLVSRQAARSLAIGKQPLAGELSLRGQALNAVAEPIADEVEDEDVAVRADRQP